MKLTALALVLLALPLPALADEEEHEGGGRGMVVTDAATKAECSACHMAYPPALLPASSWRAIMGDLPNHFGEDASLDETARSEIEAWLVANAGGVPRGVDAAATPLRISELPWFRREHADEVSPRMLAKAKSMANCAACHTGAESGSFDDD